MGKILYRRAKLVAIQAAIRGYRAKREFRPRIRGMVKVKALYDQLGPMKELVGQLKKDKDSANKKIGVLEKEMDGVLSKIQTTQVKQKDIDKMHEGLLKEMEKSL